MIRGLNALERKGEPVPPKPTERECPFCRSKIAIAATRRPHCTSELAAASSRRIRGPARRAEP